MSNLSKTFRLGWLPSLRLLLLLGIAISVVVPHSADAATCSGAPARPKLQSPANGNAVNNPRVHLTWQRDACATHYSVVVRQDVTYGRPLDAAYNLTKAKYTTRRLERGAQYWWTVEACNDIGCTTSRWGKFTLGN